MKKLVAACICLLTAFVTAHSQSKPVTVTSPDKSITVQCQTDASGQPSYSIQYKGTVVLETSKLGIVRSDADFSKALTLAGISPVTLVKDNYRLLTGKRQQNTYTANRQTIHFKNASGALVDIIWQISNDGIAF